MKKTLFILILFIFATLCIGVGGFFAWFKYNLGAPSTLPDKKEILITKGSSADKISKVLHDNGIIKNELTFKLYVRIYKLQSQLPPGQFSIAQNLTVPQVIEVLKKGPNEVWVTLPEGLRREQIPSRFVSALSLTGEKALAFADSFLSLTKGDEGYLFPETYLVPIDLTPQKAVSILKNTFDKKFGNNFTGSKNELKNTVILASIIERETRTDSEKPQIAGILKNRIAIGMPLQIDATVQYAKANSLCLKDVSGCSDWWPTVYLEDYKIVSPFNTYTVPGLPVSAISNPGIASLNAALNPISSEYYYYIHDTEGNIHFAKTLDEHNANVRKYLR